MKKIRPEQVQKKPGKSSERQQGQFQKGFKHLQKTTDTAMHKLRDSSKQIIKTHIKHITTYIKPIKTYTKLIKTYIKHINTYIKHIKHI